MSKRPPAQPPTLAGFTYLSVLGSGGFADVYLYEQHLPKRRVAVKVLLADSIVGGTAEQFAAEANVMAMLSTHPAIVTIYHAGVADDSRPYLVMEYCPKPNLNSRARSTPFSISEALRVGVQVAGAVETAHRAGILHRDIKPANILVTEYNRPALTDFGIATSGEGGVDDSAGMSIPWSPPEALADDPVSSVQSDVYSLGATMYTLLTGRSPFEHSRGRNSGADLIVRIENDPLPALGRADLPDSVSQVLSRAMAKLPAERFASALDFARALQRIQIELAHSVTPVDILDDSPDSSEPDGADGDDRTRVRAVTQINPNAVPEGGETVARRPSAQPPVEETLARRNPTPPAVPTFTAPLTPRAPGADTVFPVAPIPFNIPSDTSDTPAGTRTPWTVIILAIAAAAIVGIVIAVSVIGGRPEAAPTTPPPAQPQDPIVGSVPGPTDLGAIREGDEVVFAWANPDPQEGDAYLWAPVTLDGVGAPERVTDETVTVPLAEEGSTCIEVALVRASGVVSDPPARVCYP